MTDEKPCVVESVAFEGPKTPDRGYTIRASYLKEPHAEDALIEVMKDGHVKRRFTFPAYKIYNLQAHFKDIVDSEIENSATGYDSKHGKHGCCAWIESNYRQCDCTRCGPVDPKPAPKMVPLCSRDVRAGDQIRDIGFMDGWASVTGARDLGEAEGLGVLGEHGWHIIPWGELQRDCEISRDGGKTWQRCERPEREEK